jgi:hypothetical protein
MIAAPEYRGWRPFVPSIVGVISPFHQEHSVADPAHDSVRLLARLPRFETIVKNVEAVLGARLFTHIVELRPDSGARLWSLATPRKAVRC